MGIVTRLGRWREPGRPKKLSSSWAASGAGKNCDAANLPTDQATGVVFSAFLATTRMSKKRRQLASAAARASTNRCVTDDRRLPELIKLCGESLNVIHQPVVDFSRDYELP